MIVSYYTPAYEEEAKGLIASLDARGLKHEVVPRESQGSWAKNCGMKPAFLRERLKHRSSVWWLDADARVVADAPLFREMEVGSQVDVGLHHRQPGNELLSGTIFLRQSFNTSKLLDAWEAKCKEHPGEWDQRCLAVVLWTIPELVFCELPASYCCIPEFMPGVQPVVTHGQASRRLRGAEHKA